MNTLRMLAASVCGASHVLHGKPNQDWHGGLVVPGRGGWMAVADGHGSAAQGARGARIAVEVVGRLCGHLVSGRVDAATGKDLGAADMVRPLTLGEAQDLAAREIPQRLVGLWQAAVLRDAETLPREAVVPGGDPALRIPGAIPPGDILRMYGSTLLAVVWNTAGPTPWLMLLQIGDGDLILVHENGLMERPVAQNRRLGVETDSLAEAPRALASGRPHPGAVARVRTAVREGGAIATCLLATDGVDNAFADSAGADAFFAGCAAQAHQGNLDLPTLTAWLQECTTQGSGDDSTLAMLCRRPADVPGCPMGPSPLPYLLPAPWTPLPLLP